MEQKIRLLVVDDEEMMRNACRLVFEREGFYVVSVKDGKDAIRALEREHFDVMVTDIIMPDKEGLELIMETMAKLPRLGIVAMSGGGRLSAENYLSLASKLGAVTLQKPFSPGEILAAVQLALTKPSGDSI